MVKGGILKLGSSDNITGAVALSGNFTPVNSVVTIGNTTTEILAANTSRKGLLMQNVSDEDITYTVDGTAAVIGDDLFLAPGGAIILEGATNTLLQLEGISASGTKKLALAEWT